MIRLIGGFHEWTVATSTLTLMPWRKRRLVRLRVQLLSTFLYLPDGKV